MGNFKELKERFALLFHKLKVVGKKNTFGRM